MKNIQLTSRATDLKIMAALGSLVAFCIPAFLGGLLLPNLLPDGRSGLFLNTLIVFGLGGFAWGAFHVVKPVRSNRKWAIARYIAIPVFWLILFGGLAFLFNQLNPINDAEIVSVLSPIN
jgi:hypothetical protein